VDRIGVEAWWLIAAALLVGSAMEWGRRNKEGYQHWSGILVDSRNRYSLTRLQIVLWTILVLSLLAAVFLTRHFAGVSYGEEHNSMSIVLPGELLTLMGIAVGSTALSTVIKLNKDQTRKEKIRTNPDRPNWMDLITVEEGAKAYIDPGKFQNLWITVLAVGAYCAMSAQHVANTPPSTVNQFTLPGVDGTLLNLLLISHAGYIALKIPNRD
jgi:hypothetical protein